jgi:RNA polymerase sigma-B factor
LFEEWAGLDATDPRRDALRDRLVIEYLPVAKHIAARFAGRGEPMDDLVQVARLGLIQAIGRFDPGRGSDFLSFAVPTIMGEVRRYFRDSGWSMRVPRQLKELHQTLGHAANKLSHDLGRAPTPSEIAAHLGLDVEAVREGLLAGQAYKTVSVDLPLGGEGGAATIADQIGEYEPALEQFENRDAVKRLLDELPPRERAIIVMRFFEGLSQSRIAARVGVSQMQVSRILAQTLGTLREKLAAEA